MTKARDIADFKFENIVDTGTEGTKVASGTTAQRGSNTGQWRYNTTTGYFEGRNATGFATLEPTPTVSSIDVTEVDSQAGGNQTIVVTGTNFSAGGTIIFVGNSGTDFNASTTTYNSSTQVTAVAPKSNFLNAQEPYKVKFTSSSGVSGVSANGLINVDTAPSWSTASGSLGSVNENDTGNFTVSATDADGDTIAYSLQSGSLGGLSLNSSSGAITGTPTAVSSDTTNSFTIRATANTKTADRAFSFITVNSTLDTVDIFGDSSGVGLYRMNNSYNNESGGSFPNLSASGSPSFTSTSKYGSHAIDLVGQGKYVDVDNSTRYYAVSGWYYPTQANGTGVDAYVFEMRHDVPSNGRGYLYTLGSSQSGKIQMISTSNDTTTSNNNGQVYVNGSLLSGEYHFTANTWYHLAVSVDNASSTTQTWNVGLRLGNRSDGTSGGNGGYIDHVRIFNRALTSSEVSALYNES